MLIGLPALAANVLSTFAYQYDIRYHYGTLVLPVLVASTIFAISKARDRRPPARRGARLRQHADHCVPVGSDASWQEAAIASPSGPSVPHLEEAFALIPDDAVVSTFYTYVPHLSHREEIYQFPNSFSTHYYGTSGQAGEDGGRRPPEADRVEYVVVPTALDPQPKSIFEEIRKDFDVVYEAGVSLC